MNKARRATLNMIVNSLTELKESLETVRDEEEEAYDNLPESLQESERGETMQEAVDVLYDCTNSLDEIVDMLAQLF